MGSRRQFIISPYHQSVSLVYKMCAKLLAQNISQINVLAKFKQKSFLASQLIGIQSLPKPFKNFGFKILNQKSENESGLADG